MASRNLITSLFLTDNNIGVFCLDKTNSENNRQVDIEMENDVIVNGYIRDPYIFLERLKTAFKSIHHTPKEINFVFLGQNVLIRELTIPKSTLEKNGIYDFIKSQIGISIHFPFNEAAYYYEIKSDNENEIQVVVFIIDKNLLEDYFDVFNRIGIKHVAISLLSTDINFLYSNGDSALMDNSMIVSLLDNNITIHILENNMTVFGINEECDQASETGICDRVVDFIEKIANYYQFNLRKGKKRISKVILINLYKQLNETEFKQSISELSADFKTTVLDLSDINPDLRRDAKHSNIAYITSIANQKRELPKLDFQVERPKRGLILANYLFVVSVLIFALVSLVYIPWTNMNQEIRDLETTRDTLLIQKTMLEDNINYDSSVSSYQRDYNLAFVALDSLSLSPSNYLINLIELATGDVSISEMNVDESEHSITLLVTSSDDYNLYNYAIDIYEAYGVITDPTTIRWMLSPPETTMISSGVMRVVVYYA